VVIPLPLGDHFSALGSCKKHHKSLDDIKVSNGTSDTLIVDEDKIVFT